MKRNRNGNGRGKRAKDVKTTKKVWCESHQTHHKHKWCPTHQRWEEVKPHGR